MRWLFSISFEEAHWLGEPWVVVNELGIVQSRHTTYAEAKESAKDLYYGKK